MSRRLTGAPPPRKSLGRATSSTDRENRRGFSPARGKAPTRSPSTAARPHCGGRTCRREGPRRSRHLLRPPWAAADTAALLGAAQRKKEERRRWPPPPPRLHWRENRGKGPCGEPHRSPPPPSEHREKREESAREEKKGLGVARLWSTSPAIKPVVGPSGAPAGESWRRRRHQGPAAARWLQREKEIMI